MKRYAWLVPALYIVFVLLPIYWLLNMSFKTTNEILGVVHAVAAGIHARQLPQDLHRSDLVSRLPEFDQLCRDEHGAVGHGGAAGGVCVFALPLPRRQAPVLLAADQSHGAARGVRAAVFPAVFGDRSLRHATRGRAGALPVQHSAGGLDPGRLHVERAEGARRDRVCRRLSVLALLHSHLHSDHRGRHRRGGVLLLHVLVGRAAAREDADCRSRPSRSRRR